MRSHLVIFCPEWAWRRLLYRSVASVFGGWDGGVDSLLIAAAATDAAATEASQRAAAAAQDAPAAAAEEEGTDPVTTG